MPNPLTLSNISSKSHFPRAISIIRKYHLFVNGWSIQRWLHNPQEIKQISIAKYHQKPIAVGVILEEDPLLGYPNIGIFVKSKYRRRGIGTKIIKSLSKSKIPLKVHTGIYGSDSFYEKYKDDLNLKLLWE